MMLSKLKTMLVIKVLEKGLGSSYLIMMTKIPKSAFELYNVNIKLKILNN